MNLRNVILSIATIIVLLGPVSLFGAQKVIHIDLPAWFTAEEAAYLTGGKSDVNVRETTTLDGFVSGKFQSALETEIGNFIPMKASALLGNAFNQRLFIRASNCLFDWECYPTFYSSDTIYIPAEDRLAKMPLKQHAALETGLVEAINKVERISSRNNDVDFYMYMPFDYCYCSDAPFANLIADSINDTLIKAAFLSKVEGVEVIDSLKSNRDYLTNWFRTDHHWNIDGAFDAYDQIMKKIKPSNICMEKGSSLYYEEPRFYGSLARQGLFEGVWDHLGYYKFENDKLWVAINDKETSTAELFTGWKYEYGDYSKERFMDRYGEFFHPNYGLIVIRNLEKNFPSEEDSILIVTDSYSNCIDVLFANHYENTYILDLRYADIGIEEFLEEHSDIDDVLYLITPSWVVGETRDLLR